MLQMFAVIPFGIYLTAGIPADIRERSLSLIYLAAGAALTVLTLFLPWKMEGRALGAAMGLFFLLFSLIRPQSFGRADGALILMCGLTAGVRILTVCLMAALLAAALFGLIRPGKGALARSIPFVPFLAAGYWGGVIWFFAVNRPGA